MAWWFQIRVIRGSDPYRPKLAEKPTDSSLCKAKNYYENISCHFAAL